MSSKRVAAAKKSIAQPGAAAPWRKLVDLLRDPACQGMGAIQVVAAEDFWDEEELPFMFEGGGTVCHIIPEPGFRKESLAGSEDERLVIVDCPDEEGWIVPEDIVADWMGRNVTHDGLDDIILSHPLYEYLTAPDEDGNSRGGRGELVQWAPGIPTMASIYAPEFLPNDRKAPKVNRDRDAYADAVLDLLQQLDERFELLEVELGLRFGEEPKGDPDGQWAA